MHVAIIMDGNGRWATRRGLPRTEGHRAGAEAVRRTVEAAPALGIDTLTLYAFSSDNWKRPSLEVRTLMELFRLYLQKESERCAREGVKLSVIGRRDRLETSLRASVDAAESRTANGKKLWLRIAVDYSGRDAISTAFKSPASDAGAAIGPDVDLLIRTGGERRLSDFLLWESAYAELLFTDTFWPDFGGADLAAALTDFRQRDRRFGGLTGLSGVAA
ncbi:MAG: polyprenyl diphosphate synthase [Thermoanaerobaculia bacterium]|nr:polyprenyl diphosphate synthase [Thermoanaerobaculia bacterium]